MKKTKYLTFCAIMAALGTVILFFASFIEVMDLTAVLIASICIFVTVEELGVKSVYVYIITSVISILIIPSKLIAVEYILFGIYPAVKKYFEKVKKPICVIFKVGYILLSVAAVILIMKFVFMLHEIWYLEIIFFVCGIVAFFIYDIALSRLNLLYKNKLRHQLGIDKFFR